MRRAAGRIVAMGTEVSLLFARVTPNEIALHPRRLELKHALDMGKYATCDAVTHLVDKLAINNDAITTTFVTPIVYEHRSTINFPHKTRLCAAIELVQINQTLTQCRFKYAGKFDDRGMTVPKSRGLPQLCDRL